MRDRARPRLAELIKEIAHDETTSPEPFPTHRVTAVPPATFEALKGHAPRLG